jgi:hypothetical protein
MTQLSYVYDDRTSRTVEVSLCAAIRSAADMTMCESILGDLLYHSVGVFVISARQFRRLRCAEWVIFAQYQQR